MRKYDIDLAVDVSEAILWQYNNAPNLISLVNKIQEYYDKANVKFWQDWHRDVFDVDTANAFGLEVWSRILGIESGVAFEPQKDKIAFGFGKNRKRFGLKSNFGSRSGGFTGFTLEQKRLLIKARVFELTQSPTLTNINRWLKQNLWEGESKVYVSDPMNMKTAIYTFLYQPNGFVMFMLDNIDFLPRPSTVNVEYRIIGKDAFGFGRNRKNFNKPSNFGVLK